VAAESKIIITAEDRTAAAFAAVERNTGRTALAVTKLTSNMLQLAGVGSLLAFFRANAESTEKWRDEMARLDDITKEFFSTAADAGRLDPFILAIKQAHLFAMGAGVAIENMGLAIGSLAAAGAAAAKLEFAEAKKIIELSNQDMAANEARFAKLKEQIDKEAPKGYVKAKEAEEERIKKLNESLKKSEEERLKTTIENAKAAEDAIRAEGEISPEFSKAGLTRMGESVLEEKFQKEQELRLRQSEAIQKQRDQDIEALLISQTSETDLTNQKYANDLQTLYDARESEYLTEAQFKQAREQLELEHQAKLGDLRSQGELRAQQISEMSATAQTQTMLEMFAQLSSASAQHNRAAFTVNKIMSVGIAVMRMYESAVTSFAWGARHGGPVAGAIAAAAAVALQLPAVNAIKNLSYGSTSSAPSIGGGSATPVYDTQASVPDLSPKQPAPSRNVTVMVQSDSGVVSTQWIRDQLIPSINDALGDGVTLNIA